MALRGRGSGRIGTSRHGAWSREINNWPKARTCSPPCDLIRSAAMPPTGTVARDHFGLVVLAFLQNESAR